MALRMDFIHSFHSLAQVPGAVPNGGRRNQEMQQDAEEAKRLKFFMNWLMNYPCPTTSVPTWTRHP